MSFPWGLLFVHIGVGLLFKSAVEKWAMDSIQESIMAETILITAERKQHGAGSESSDEESEEDGDVDSDLEAVGA